MKRKGFTLVEVIITAGILSLLISISIGIFIYFSRTAQKEDKEQEYWKLYLLLDARLKQDLRSAMVVEKLAPRVFRLNVIKEADGVADSRYEVWYLVDSEDAGVERVIRYPDGTQRSMLFDFTRVLDEGQAFIFDIGV